MSNDQRQRDGIPANFPEGQNAPCLHAHRYREVRSASEKLVRHPLSSPPNNERVFFTSPTIMDVIDSQTEFSPTTVSRSVTELLRLEEITKTYL